MASNAPESTYEDTVGQSTVRWPRVYNPVIGLRCLAELGGCGAAPGELCTREPGSRERVGHGRATWRDGRVEKACPCRARIMQASAGLWPDIVDPEPPAPRATEMGAEPVELDDQPTLV